MNADEPLTRAELRLTEIAYSRSHDRFLLDLLTLADAGGAAVVGLLLNGMIVIGALANGRAMADEVDRHGLRLIKSMERQLAPGERPANWDDIVHELSSGATRKLDTREEREAELQEGIREHQPSGPIDISALPGGLAERMIANEARDHLTLTDAQIYSGGAGGSNKVAVMRVQLDQIAGWWLINVDEAGRASFKLFADEDVTG